IGVHRGIQTAYGKVATEIHAFVMDVMGGQRTEDLPEFMDKDTRARFEYENRENKARIFVTGHSLGGSMAQLCALDMVSLFGPAAVVAYTFGQPRLGNKDFCSLYQSYVQRFFRVTNAKDPVPHAPGMLSGYHHPADSKIKYAYPPLKGRAGWAEHFAGKKTGFGAVSESISDSNLTSFRHPDQALRVHSHYCGILIPIRRKEGDTFNFQ
ncbi:hypothetical protein KIPB_011881, partial [Kipferlia bialata]